MDMTREERLAKIMGAPDSPTGKLVALRQTPPATGDLTPGVWYSNFTRVKEEAERRGLPFIGMWTNGDLCGFCRRFTENILVDNFLKWMTGVKCLFWLGGSFDENREDGRGGIGFNFLRGPEGKVSYFPFVCVVNNWDVSHKSDFFGSGHDYDERRKAPNGTASVLFKLHNLLYPNRPAKLAPLDALKQDVPDTPVRQTTPDAGVAETPVSEHRLSIRHNPKWDSANISRFLSALSDNGGHCPCRPERTPDTKCMCRAFLDQTTPGPCHCGAYEKYTV